MDAKLAAMSEEELKAFKEGVTQRRTERRGDKQGKRQKQLQVRNQFEIQRCSTLAACCQAGTVGTGVDQCCGEASLAIGTSRAGASSSCSGHSYVCRGRSSVSAAWDAAVGPQPGRHWESRQGKPIKQQKVHRILLSGVLTAFPLHMPCCAMPCMVLHTRSWQQACGSSSSSTISSSSSSISRWGHLPAGLCCRRPALQLMRQPAMQKQALWPVLNFARLASFTTALLHADQLASSVWHAALAASGWHAAQFCLRYSSAGKACSSTSAATLQRYAIPQWPEVLLLRRHPMRVAVNAAGVGRVLLPFL